MDDCNGSEVKSSFKVLKFSYFFFFLRFNTSTTGPSTCRTRSCSSWIVFELEFSTSYAVPQHLKMRHRFTLQIGVRPKNDVPFIELRRGALLRLAKGTKKLLPSNLIEVKDPDDDPSEIAVTLVSPVTGEETLSYGHIENDKFPGTFSR